MKKYLILLLLAVLSISKSYSAVEQIPDILIIDNDTVYMKSFPLEELKLVLQPFDYGGGIGFPNEACMRGYQATWVVIDFKLCLKEIRKIGSKDTVDLADYFYRNNYTANFIGGMVFANWYSANMVYYFRDSRDYIYKPSVRMFWDKPRVKFENGLMTINRLKEA